LNDGYDWNRLNLQSVTEEDSFQDFLRTAELAGTEFQAEKLNIQFVNPKSNVGLLSAKEKADAEKKMIQNKEFLRIPRRPKWDKKTTPEELNAMENAEFLEWRRCLAQLQETEELLMTPYEKNLEFWRQLWRVVEKSDVVVQIVDARNPLLFRSEDLEKYVKEVDPIKKNILLLNKADFLNDYQRQQWAEYFDDLGMTVAFFSALDEEQNDIEEEKSSSEEEIDENSSASEDEEATSENALLSLGEIKSKLKEIESVIEKTEQDLEVIENVPESTKSSKNNPNVLTRQELIDFFKEITRSVEADRPKTIGLIGYPNVGKSSTINALLMEKKVSVSATPGKTKHFQTLFLEKDLILCDCCGLVLPSFCATKADMVLNGILPIDQLRDHVPPINLLCSLIPRHVLEQKYGILIVKPMEGENPDRPPHSEELLLAYGCKNFTKYLFIQIFKYLLHKNRQSWFHDSQWTT
jgi:large subunit GTPase 1